MNPVPPLTTILMEFLLSGGAEQTNSLVGCENSVNTPYTVGISQMVLMPEYPQDAQKGRPARRSERRGEAYASVR